MSSPQYTITLEAPSMHFVGYAPEKDLMFEFWVQGDLVFYFSPEVTDALLVTPIVNIDGNKFINLGEL